VTEEGKQAVVSRALTLPTGHVDAMSGELDLRVGAEGAGGADGAVFFDVGDPALCSRRGDGSLVDRDAALASVTDLDNSSEVGLDVGRPRCWAGRPSSGR
jgi:hypothetical protein